MIASQIRTHAPYGGVVPELASREHLQNIVPVVRAALQQAECTLKDLDAIAVTEGPGLAGALLVGVMYAKGLAYALNKPLIAVNHLEGHIHAVLLEAKKQQQTLAQPTLALVVSGGHTHLYLAEETQGTWHYKNVGRTVDDAAGEAFDKVSKLLGLGYPGGPWIDWLAQHGDPHAVPFGPITVKQKPYRAAQVQSPRFLFSFSGLKTAILRYVQLHDLKPSIETRHAALAKLPDAKPADALALCDTETLNLIASFPARGGRRSGSKNIQGSGKLSCSQHRGFRRCGRKSRIAPAFSSRGSKTPPAGHLSRARTFNRQCRHDCRSCVAEICDRGRRNGKPDRRTFPGAGLDHFSFGGLPVQSEIACHFASITRSADRSRS